MIYDFFCRDDAPSPLDPHHDDTLNSSSATMTPGKPVPGTSLDSSSASSEDESFTRDLDGTWNSPDLFTQLTDADKKRQEIIKGE
jgi:hypothetical protein